jgi:sugar phosphate isomerase/epimerase
MKIGFLTACLPQLSLEDLLKWAAQQGFQALELAAWPSETERDYQAKQINTADFKKDDAKKIKELLARYNMSISAMAYYENNLHPDLQQRDFYINHLHRVIDAAALLGVPLVGTFAGARADLSPAENIKEIGTVFKKITAYASIKGIKIMIENCPMMNWLKFGLPGNYAYSPELWSALFNEVPAENFGLNFDPSHLYWLGIDYIQAVKYYSKKIFHAHAKDTEMLPEGKFRYGTLNRQIEPQPWQSGWWRYRIPGLGEIDWKRFIATLQEYGYDNVLSIEHEDPVWDGTEEKVKQGLQQGLKHLTQFVL